VNASEQLGANQRSSLVKRQYALGGGDGYMGMSKKLKE
jgi:hypothetical protein